MRELREDTFSENKNDDAYEHVERILDIVNFFNILRVTRDAVMLHVFLITLTGAAKSLRKSTTSSRKVMKHCTKIGRGCENYRGAHLNKECSLNKEVKSIKEVKYREYGRPFLNNNGIGARYCVGLPGYYTHVDNRPPFGKKKTSLEELMNKHPEESTRRRA
uniref:DNA-binding pseudobarrel domain-containing protein n=1 Tax=Tanacetum cinerariifolium TaxID=118510 RepID=A0A6L2LY77_TANCI|nr:DNA-binding pseudobarrel domain-containing protein [Tanacetum cinerariifolium]